MEHAALSAPVELYETGESKGYSASHNIPTSYYAGPVYRGCLT